MSDKKPPTSDPAKSAGQRKVSKDKDADRLVQHTKLRRRWVTWLRMARYGANNFTRNAWLTTAATAVMTVTLLIVFSTYAARSVLMDTVADFRKKIDISIYLENDVTTDTVATLSNKLYKLSNVNEVRYINASEARKSFIQQNKPSAELLQTISDLPDNPIPQSLRVSVKDTNKLADLEKLIKDDDTFQAAVNKDPTLQPSYAGARRETINNLDKWIRTIERVGVIASAIFVSISMLIIFNTIRMAIFNRRDEIEMMKLIGAERGFIRGPFVVEAVMYGFFAALLATGIGYVGLFAMEPGLQKSGIAVAVTSDMLVTFAPVVLLAIIGIGALIGIISSRLAVRRYLRV